jgi:hypothetical protein
MPILYFAYAFSNKAAQNSFGCFGFRQKISSLLGLNNNLSSTTTSTHLPYFQNRK